jgi:2-polyprenyl-6-methoxyphenol hydroxylase-like FAD-dependent oxidoreductase
MPEALVVGGGPAGACAARLLALWGHSVRLVTPSVPVSPSREADLAESLPPSCRKLFDVLGVAADIDRAGFIRSTGNTVWWGDQATRVERFRGDERGWQITRARLSGVLLDAARGAGVEIEDGRLSASDLDNAIESVVLDCSGRSGIVARARGWRVYEPELRTVALVGVWRAAGEWPLPDPTHTLIESYADGWMWSVPSTRSLLSGQVPDVARHVAAMVDPRATELAPGTAREIYLAEIAKTTRFRALLAGAQLEAGPSGWDASMYSSHSYADDRVLLVGDAGSFIDPLSSAGVKKALASGWLAAVAAHTALVRPAMRATAFTFFEAREREIYDHFRALTRRFLAEAAAGHTHPFWSDRIGWIDSDPPVERADERVLQAFQRIRATPVLALRRGEAVRIEQRPAVNGREIVMEPWIVTPGQHPVRYAHEVDVVGLLELAPQFADAGELFAVYVRRFPPVAPPDFLTALATAVANGWLVWRDD